MSPLLNSNSAANIAIQSRKMASTIEAHRRTMLIHDFGGQLV